ncbi:hypothetical protein glysoja_006936, partial [Glycine soja]
GVGICLRADQGNFTKAITMLFLGLPEPREAEAMTLLQALHWISDMNISSINFELNCKNVVDGINS